MKGYPVTRRELLDQYFRGFLLGEKLAAAHAAMIEAACKCELCCAHRLGEEAARFPAGRS